MYFPRQLSAKSSKRDRTIGELIKESMRRKSEERSQRETETEREHD